MEKGTGKKKVMVAIDESEFSHYALEWTLENLRETIEDSKLVVFTAQPLADYIYLYASTLGATRMSPNFNFQSVAADTFTEVGNPKEVILNAVEKLKIQLLVVGNHGRGAVQRAFLGSVSSFCVHNAKCPVLVVRKTD
ncbi:hypothetical protein ACS0TY_033298 [Phlomoides rotata]